MYFWKIDSLADELRQDRVTEPEAFKYFFVVTFLESAPFMFPYRDQTSMSFDVIPVGYVVPALWMFSTLVGLTLCFRVNQRGDGKDFIRRFICLIPGSLVRTLVFCLIPFVLVGGMLGSILFAKQQSDTVALVESWIMIEAMLIVQYTIMYKRIRRISEPQPGEQQPVP